MGGTTTDPGMAHRGLKSLVNRYYQSLPEKDRRRYAGIEAIKLGYGGISYSHRVLGCDYRTIKARIAYSHDFGLLSVFDTGGSNSQYDK